MYGFPSSIWNDSVFYGMIAFFTYFELFGAVQDRNFLFFLACSCIASCEYSSYSSWAVSIILLNLSTGGGCGQNFL